MSLFDVDFNNIKVDRTFDAIPAGTYNVISDNAEIKQTKDGTGSYIVIAYKILDGEYAGRLIFSNFNTANKNTKAVEIGLQQLKGFMESSGIKQNKIKTPTELVGYKAQAVVKHKTDSYGTKAVVSYFKPLNKDGIAVTQKGADGLW